MKEQISNTAILTRAFVFSLTLLLGLALWLGKDLFWGECSAHSSHIHHIWNTLGVDACESQYENAE